jgi:hypothetical protein
MTPKQILALCGDNQSKAAEFCGVSRNSIRMWIAEGRVPVEAQLRLQHETENTEHPLIAELPYGYIAVKSTVRGRK